MGAYCVVVACRSRKGHRFPITNELRNAWITRIRREGWSPSRHSRVCSDHFLPSDFVQVNTYGGKCRTKQLKKGAVPSVFWWNSPGPEMTAQDEQHAEQGGKRDTSIAFEGELLKRLLSTNCNVEVQTRTKEFQRPDCVPEPGNFEEVGGGHAPAVLMRREDAASDNMNIIDGACAGRPRQHFDSMDSVPKVEKKVQNAQTLLWCCFCDARFKKPAHLSKHLDKYNVNWKLYWQLFYSERSGRACSLCNILHADRKSLECHFKMVHCINGRCASRASRPPVITLQDEPSEGKRDRDQANVGEDRPLPESCQQTQPRSLCPQNEPETHTLKSVNIDIPYESSPSGHFSNEASRVTSESLHPALPSTSSKAAPGPSSDDEVQIIPHPSEKSALSSTSGTNLGGNRRAVVAGDKNSTQLATPSASSNILHSDDEAENVDSCELDVVSRATSPDLVHDGADITGRACAQFQDAGTTGVSHDATRDALDISPRTQVPSAVIGGPSSLGFPGESRQTRPTAVVNPFDSREGECTLGTSGDSYEYGLRRLPASAMVPSHSPPQTTVSDESSDRCPVQDTVSHCSREPVSCDELLPTGSTNDLGAGGAKWLGGGSNSGTPPQSPGSIDGELTGKWSSERRSVSDSDLPDLSRLTPSKIAAFMNRDVFSAEHRSDLDKHFERKPLIGLPSQDSDGLTARMCPASDKDRPESCTDSDTPSDEDDIPETLSEPPGSESPSNDPDKCCPMSGRSSPTSPVLSEGSESLPCGLSIVNVESLMTKSFDTDDEMEEPNEQVSDQEQGLVASAALAKSLKTKENVGTMWSRKRGLSRTLRDSSLQDELSARTEKKVERAPEEVSHDASRSSQVIKQPIGQCVGVIHPSSLVEVFVKDTPMPSNARSSLDGMVMKVEQTACSVRYFIHFPNIAAQHDRWVSKEDIIQVYRTAEGSERPALDPVRDPVRSPVSPGQAKRRLAFQLDRDPDMTKRLRTSDAADPQPDAANSAQSLPGRPSRPPRTGRLRAVGGHHRSRSRPKTKSALAASPLKLRQTRRTATNRASKQKSPQYRKDVTDVARAVKAADVASGASHLAAPRVRRACRLSAEALGHDRTEGAKGASGDDHVAVSPALAGGKTPGESAPAARAQTGADAEPVRTSSANSSVQTLGNVHGRTAQQGNGRPAGRNTGFRLCKDHPGTIRLLVAEMLDEICPGTLVYVTFGAHKKGYLRLRAAEVLKIDKDLGHVRYWIHYVGWPARHDEWIDPDVVHSVLDVDPDDRFHPSLKTSVLLGSDEAEALNEQRARPAPAPSDVPRAYGLRASTEVAGPASADGAPPKTRGCKSSLDDSLGRKPAKEAFCCGVSEQKSVSKREGLGGSFGSEEASRAAQTRQRPRRSRTKSFQMSSVNGSSNLVQSTSSSGFPTCSALSPARPAVHPTGTVDSLDGSAQHLDTPIPPADGCRGQTEKPNTAGPGPMCAQQIASSAFRPDGPALRLPDDTAVQPASPGRQARGPDIGGAASSASSVPRQYGTRRKRFRTARFIPEAEQERSSAAPVTEIQQRRRRLKHLSTSDASAAVTRATAAVAGNAFNGRRRDRRRNVPRRTVVIPTFAPTPERLGKLKAGDVIYAIHGIKKDGTKYTYPAKILKANKDFGFDRYFIHYLGWSPRHNEWIAKEVIHFVVDLSRLETVPKFLKRVVILPPNPSAQRLARRRVRPCSVDLSINNICFFSALRKERSGVNDRRIMALRAAARAGGGGK